MTLNDHIICAHFYRRRAIGRIKQIITLRRDSYEHGGIGWMRNEAIFQYIRTIDDFRAAQIHKEAALEGGQP